MTHDLELVTTSTWTDTELHSALATAWFAHGLTDPEITGTITDNVFVEIATDDELSLQVFRPHTRTTQAGPRLVTAMTMSTDATDTLINAVLDVVTTLATDHHGHLTINGEPATLHGLPAPDPAALQPAAPDPGPQPNHPPVFAAVFLDTPTPGDQGWQTMVSALATWIGDHHHWRPTHYQPDEEWEPFTPDSPTPAWWPDFVDLTTRDHAIEWMISDNAFPQDRLAKIDASLRVPTDETGHLLDQVTALEPWQPVYAMVHPWHEQEPFAVYGPRSDSHDGPWLMLHDRALTQGLPNIYWGNILGQPWVDLIGADRIATTPAHRVEEVLPGRWLLQLTPRPSDVTHDWDNFAEVRQQCITHLGREHFHNPERMDQSADRTASIPTLEERGLVQR